MPGFPVLRPRLRLSGAIHHLILRSRGGEPLFAEASDRVFLDTRIGELLRAYAARAHAYCWMTNHLHLVVEINAQRAAALQAEIAVEYARYWHQLKPSAGDIFRPPTRPFRADIETHILHLIRYVHLNPVAAGLVTDPVDYPWCGHRAYLGLGGPDWMSVDVGLRLLGGDLLRAVAAYRTFVGFGGEPLPGQLTE
jgi:REP element-mobilizing transposase RayT